MHSLRAGINRGRLVRAVSRLSRQRDWYSSSSSLCAPLTNAAFSCSKKYRPALTTPQDMRLKSSVAKYTLLHRSAKFSAAMKVQMVAKLVSLPSRGGVSVQLAACR